MRSIKGYRADYHLTNRKTGEAISKTFWDSKDDAITNVHNDYIAEASKQVL